MNYTEAIEFLESRIRFGIRPGTERVAAIAEALDHPERSYPIVHVAGTNAKFSVVALVTAVLAEAGMTVGTYTSPHIEVVRERIALAGHAIDEETFARVVEYLVPYVLHVEADREDQLTHFELLTTIAFEAFFDRAVHAAVLETGLGGEFDATNVADGRVAVVTNVSLDHVRQFGRDLRKAAWEKAGIIKEGSFVVTGVEQPDLLEIVEDRVRERGARGVARLGDEIEVMGRSPAVGGQVVTVKGLYATYDDVFVALFGEHQATNAALAIAATEAFFEEALDDEVVRGALAGVRAPGRLEVLRHRPLIVCDGGHNPAASARVREAVVESFAYDRLVMVVAMVNEKLIEEALAVWAHTADEFIVAAFASDRSAPPERLREALESEGVSSEQILNASTVAEAVELALERAASDDMVLVFGSFYTVGEAKAWLRSQGALSEA